MGIGAERTLNPMPVPENPEPEPRTDKMGRVLCRARAKSKLREGLTGEAALCERPAVIGYAVCERHGAYGGRPAVTGRYSTVLKRMRTRYEESLGSDNLLDMNEQVAALDALTKRVGERLGDLDTQDLRTRALEKFNEARAASSAGDDDASTAALTALGKLLREGVAEDVELERFGRHLERLSKRIEATWNVKLNKQTAINQRDLVTVMARFVGIMQEELSAADAARCAKRIELELDSGGAFIQPTSRQS